jgi:hypothetical protein
VKAFLKAGILSEDGTLKDNALVLRKADYAQLRIMTLMSSAGLCAMLDRFRW